ncbi:sensor domain-containing diguanylate cyclase [Hydrogenimonas cancrithermarum]|uniref:diguanylate cyclase n=1 Tax=Hydrogenimonas cancrithermarum TaxID=2993563 RepID=A0ABN6WVQ1_9BACT|nr:GGDEF domain-containing protein [Hydrogenimonas cancrithermarum]BDY12262.1 GGDEF domain-containing protein [Hydrogenimonas cancrithermarum]
MDTKRKLFLFTSLLLILFSVAIMINAALNFRNYAYKSSIEKAKLTAEIVRDGLTAHMVNGIMEKRRVFLDSIARTKNIKKLWIVRSENVSKQYGKGLENEMPRDNLDKRVLETGQAVERLSESTAEALLRVTIPYTASAYSDPNCLECHNVKERDVLGAISLEFDISDIRRDGIFTLLKIAAITFVFIVLALFAVKIILRPYLAFFEMLQESLKRARLGDFSRKVEANVASRDIRAVADLYNLLIEKFQNTIGTIEHKLAILLKNPVVDSADPLENASRTIDLLSKIHRFKLTIEHDVSLPEIYDRIANVVREIMQTDHFVIFSVESKENRRDILYTTEPKPPCSEVSMELATECRAYRTGNSVNSDQFPDLCPHYHGSFAFYYCMPFSITENYSLIIMLLENDAARSARFQKSALTLQNYLENAKPVIESRLLMQKLHEKSMHDGLTGVYNRKFLEEFIDKVNQQADRHATRYAVLMLDIDFFKKVNDTYGHDVGDQFIKLLADTIVRSVRSSDIVARYGGEEFVVLLHESTPEGAEKVAETIRKRFEEQSLLVQGTHVSKTVSIGLSLFPEVAKTLREAIKYADVALYRAKEEGRNRVVVFTPEMFDSESY